MIAAVMPGGVTTNLAVATIQAGKLYLFGTQPWDNFGKEIPIYTWNFTFNVLAIPTDTTPPTAPTNLVAFDITTNGADISWTGLTDGNGLTGYRVRTRPR